MTASITHAKVSAISDDAAASAAGEVLPSDWNAAHTLSNVAASDGKLSQFAATTSAELAGVISDETGTGKLVFDTGPTFSGVINVGTAGGTTGAITLNGTTSGTVSLTVAAAAGTTTFKLPTGDGSNGQFMKTNGSGQLSFATISGGGDALTSSSLAQFASTTSLELKTLLSDETGSGAAVFANTPTLVSPLLGTPTSGTLTNCTGLPEGGLTTSDITTANVTSTKHGFAPKSGADATTFLNGATTPAYAQVKDSDLATTDITTNNASTSKHGFAPKYPNDATKYLDGTGAYTVPAGGGGSADNLIKNGIYGLNPTYTSATAFGAGAGCAWSEGDAASFYKSSALADLTGLTGTSAHFYHVYAYNNSGTITIDTPIDGGVAGSTSPPILFANPAGSARSKSGATTRRFIGSILWGATNTIRPFQTRDIGGGNCEYIYLTDTGAAAPFAVMANGTSTSYAAIDFSALIPNNGTAYEAFLTITTTNAGGQPIMYFSLDGTGFLGVCGNTVNTTTPNLYQAAWFPINSTTTTGLYYKMSGASMNGSVSCWGYRYRR